MTEEQTKAIEALTLRDGGFAAADPLVVVAKTPAGVYIVDRDGEATKVTELESERLDQLERGVYGRSGV